uniref:MORN repeat-containing protein 3 n=1 Tax=Denticeps clupeoides TaxID=299321 RepID=A0AAY4DFZ9_9TELE
GPLSKAPKHQSEKRGSRKTIFKANGDFYKGTWMNNKRHGVGVQFWKKYGLEYAGDWQNDKRHGVGTLNKYMGEWKNDLKDGKGKYYNSTISHYDGQWQKGQKCGHGKMIYPNGDIYRNWENGFAKSGNIVDTVHIKAHPIPEFMLHERDGGDVILGATLAL